MHLVGTDIICIVEFGPKEHEENGVGIVNDGRTCMRTSQQVSLLVGSYILNFPAVGWHSQHKYILNSGQFGDNLGGAEGGLDHC